MNERIVGASVLSSWIRSICQTVRGYGVDPLPLMEQAGLEANLLNIPDARYPVQGVRRLWQLIIQATDDPLVGLRVGREIQASTLHGLGLAMMSSSSLSELLMLFIRYGKVISTTMQMSLEHNRTGTTLVLRTVEGSEPMSAARLAALAFIFRQACSLSQHGVVPEFVTLTLAAPRDVHRLDAYFGTAVSLGAEQDAICFRYADTIEPYAGANAQLVALNETVINQYLAQLMRSDFSAQVQSRIHATLSRGEPKLAEIAALLNMTPRTLQRRLEEEGHTFNALLDGERKNLAHDLLAHSDRTITEISFLLGFSDPSNFSRASKRWFGCAPLQHRQRSLRILT
ncbi:MAG: AraC family transcriptional regulator ligand-binding domain-containing protein [Cardiobacteriaceae bacterium]|nr:AraC family transcriptional regulator ligand-binding domain-containing protein [Cardiobacteriaceae bacterium]